MLFKTKKPLGDSTGHSLEKGEAEGEEIWQGEGRHEVCLFWGRMVAAWEAEADDWSHGQEQNLLGGWWEAEIVI